MCFRSCEGFSGLEHKWAKFIEWSADDYSADGENGRSLAFWEFPGNWVRFRHPLLRSAVYRHGANTVDRRQAHRVWSEESHPDLRVWHLAAAAIVPNEELAAELQHTAEPRAPAAATRPGPRCCGARPT